MKSLLVISLVSFVAIATHAEDSCMNSYLEKGLVQGSINSSIDCYKLQLENKSISRADQSHAMNQLAYLHFFVAERTADKATRSKLQTAAKTYAEKSVALFGPSLNYDNYKDLDSDSRRVLTRALYLDGVLLARIAEEKGGFAVVSKWSEIQKIMNMCMRLGHPDVEYYGAHRTLAIANTRMPAMFGDRQLARNYFELIQQNTKVGTGPSALIVNNILYSELLFKENQSSQACQLLEAAANVTDEWIQLNAPAHIAESLKERDEAKAIIQKQCQ